MSESKPGPELPAVVLNGDVVINGIGLDADLGAEPFGPVTVERVRDGRHRIRVDLDVGQVTFGEPTPEAGEYDVRVVAARTLPPGSEQAAYERMRFQTFPSPRFRTDTIALVDEDGTTVGRMHGPAITADDDEMSPPDLGALSILSSSLAGAGDSKGSSIVRAAMEELAVHRDADRICREDALDCEDK